MVFILSTIIIEVKNKIGSNISLGFQGGSPGFSGGYAINRMLINKDDNQTDSFLGSRS